MMRSRENLNFKFNFYNCTSFGEELPAISLIQGGRRGQLLSALGPVLLVGALANLFLSPLVQKTRSYLDDGYGNQ